MHNDAVKKEALAWLNALEAKRNLLDANFMKQTHVVAELSKDESTKLGAIIVGPNNELRSSGRNSFPRGINDNDPTRQERPKKYLYMVHAEANAILNVARAGGAPLAGCRIYCAWPPCANCAQAIIQAGIVEVIYEQEMPAERWSESMNAAREMLDEAKVSIRKISE